jgi:hypothetical protein
MMRPLGFLRGVWEREFLGWDVLRSCTCYGQGDRPKEE